MRRGKPRSTLCPYTTLFRSGGELRGSEQAAGGQDDVARGGVVAGAPDLPAGLGGGADEAGVGPGVGVLDRHDGVRAGRSAEHTSELQSRPYLVIRFLLETNT